MSGLVGCTITRLMRPVACKPMFFHVLPASVDLYTPLPIACAGLMRNVSPVPAQTWLGLDGAIARAPIDELSWLSNMGAQVSPASSVLKIPPLAAPTYDTMRLPGTPATAMLRLPSGPRYLNGSLANTLS